MSEFLFLGGFLSFITAILALDLGILNKNSGGMSLKKAAVMSTVFVGFSIGFYFFLFYFGDQIHQIDSIEKLKAITERHHHAIKIIPKDLESSLHLYRKNLAVEYLTGYIVEYALSVDNIFVILLIFSSFNVPKAYYHRVLFWGIIGAIVMRLIFIFVGAALIEKFEWIPYIFGGFLIYSGIRMFIEQEKKETMETHSHPVVKFANKYLKVHDRYVEDKFWGRFQGVWKITPLFLVLVIIEVTDLIFAVDSIPAIFSVTKDPYIVFFSNIFAILGLRSMFFLLAGFLDKLSYLKVGLSFLLVFIGIKMLLHTYLEEMGFRTNHSLIIISLILGISVLASFFFPKKQQENSH
ncbi:MAG: TerC/Alx family metal homeostasis membrane protein [Bergeyella sp.]|nr:TerC/Alx family metal homeostasis membrane protein [Bergeyella sp.]